MLWSGEEIRDRERESSGEGGVSRKKKDFRGKYISTCFQQANPGQVWNSVAESSIRVCSLTYQSLPLGTNLNATWCDEWQMCRFIRFDLFINHGFWTNAQVFYRRWKIDAIWITPNSKKKFWFTAKSIHIQIWQHAINFVALFVHVFNKTIHFIIIAFVCSTLKHQFALIILLPSFQLLKMVVYHFSCWPQCTYDYMCNDNSFTSIFCSTFLSQQSHLGKYHSLTVV